MKTKAEREEKIRVFSLELAAELGEISGEEHGSPFAPRRSTIRSTQLPPIGVSQKSAR